MIVLFSSSLQKLDQTIIRLYYKCFCQPQVSFLPTILAIPQFLIKGFPPKEDPKLSFEGNKVHTLLKLFQGESSKQDSILWTFCRSLLSSLPHSLSLSPTGLHLLPPSALPRESKHASPREKERESVANLIRGSYNGPQYIVTLQSPESVAKHSIHKCCFLFFWSPWKKCQQRSLDIENEKSIGSNK